MNKPVTANYVWYDAQGNGRNLYGMFRRSFTVRGKVTSARLSLFADTSYQLFINGVFVDFGPVRCDYRFPQYDVHDIAKYLVAGKNVVALEVNFFGFKTYKAMTKQAAFVAWGNVVTGAGDQISLETSAGQWRGKRSDAHWQYSSKMSFALNPGDRYDQSREEHGWKTPAFDDSFWPDAVPLQEQNVMGELSPRTIPFMDGTDLPLARLNRVSPLVCDEVQYSFSVPVPHFFTDEAYRFSNFLAFTTWVYSPVDQQVPVAVFWGENWINGTLLDRGVESGDKPMRIMQIWNLKKGWNHFFGKLTAYQDIFEHYWAFPARKGIVVSADKNPDSPVLFRHSPVITAEQYKATLEKMQLPYPPQQDLSCIGGWIAANKGETAQSPCREACWDTYGDPVEQPDLGSLSAHTFAREVYPNGFSIMFALDHTRLVLPRLKMSGVRGAVIDVTFAEMLSPDNLHFRHTHQHMIGDRIYCIHDTIDWMSTHPRGGRFMRVTVRQPKSDIRIESLSLRNASYPARLTGSFTCSDPLLTQVWAMGARTQATNMEDAYVDCVGRERGMYGRDTIIQYHVNLALFGDHKLMGRCFELYGQSPDATGKFRAVYPNTGNYTISDFALNMLEGYLAYYRQSGDLSRIKTDWEAIQGNLKWFHGLADERTDMLLDSEWHIRKGVKAHYGGFHGDLGIVKDYMHNTGIHCVFSCTYLIALKAALDLAVLLGKKEDASQLRRRIKVLTVSIGKFWNARKGCYSDNLKRTSHSAHASLFAIRAGVATKSQIASIQKYVAVALENLFVNGYDPKNGVYSSPSFCFYMLDGLYRAGLYTTAENLMRQGWGWALAQGLKTCPEYFAVEDSLCHAWSASPTYYLSKYVLGVDYPDAPDCNTVCIAVKTDSITQAEGSFPHPRGVVKVKWHLDSKGKRVFDYVKVPRGVTVVSRS